MDNDKKTTTPGLRKYFAEDSFSRLFEENLVQNLRDILEFWEVVNCREAKESKWTTNFSILSILDILSSYPNEFWKYPVIIYYLKNKNSEKSPPDSGGMRTARRLSHPAPSLDDGGRDQSHGAARQGPV